MKDGDRFRSMIP